MTKAKSKSLGQYMDVAEVLDFALANGGARYTLATKGEAYNFRYRAYSYRQILRNLDAEAKADKPGIAATTKYDILFLVIEDADPCVVVVKLRKPKGTLSTLDGAEASMTGAAPNVDPLEEEALLLLKEHGG